MSRYITSLELERAIGRSPGLDEEPIGAADARLWLLEQRFIAAVRDEAARHGVAGPLADELARATARELAQVQAGTAAAVAASFGNDIELDAHGNVRAPSLLEELRESIRQRLLTPPLPRPEPYIVPPWLEDRARQILEPQQHTYSLDSGHTWSNVETLEDDEIVSWDEGEELDAREPELEDDASLRERCRIVWQNESGDHVPSFERLMHASGEELDRLADLLGLARSSMRYAEVVTQAGPGLELVVLGPSRHGPGLELDPKNPAVLRALAATEAATRPRCRHWFGDMPGTFAIEVAQGWDVAADAWDEAGFSLQANECRRSSLAWRGMRHWEAFELDGDELLEAWREALEADYEHVEGLTGPISRHVWTATQDAADRRPILHRLGSYAVRFGMTRDATFGPMYVPYVPLTPEAIADPPFRMYRIQT